MNNTSKKQVFDPKKLEKLLIKGWIEFVNPRNLLNFIIDNVKIKFHISDPKIQTLIISNCELRQEGVFLWIDYNIVNSNSSVNLTDEVLLRPDGSVEITKTI